MEELKITNDNFRELVEDSDVPVIVDFWASWCGPCRMLAPVISEIAEEADGKYKVGKVNVDEEEELALKYDIMSIPTVLRFEGGEIVARSIGFCGKDELLSKLFS